MSFLVQYGNNGSIVRCTGFLQSEIGSKGRQGGCFHQFSKSKLFVLQKETLQVMGDMGVAPQAWGPLSEGQKDIFHNKTLTAIGKKHGKSAAQVILRWHIQRGVAVIPKTVHKERMKENLDIWDFELSEREMERIALLDIGHSEIMDNHCWCTARQLNSFRIHA